MEELAPTPVRDEDIAVIVAYLTQLRKDLGLTQWDVALRTGTSQSHVSETETGQTAHPRSDILALMCRAYGLRLTVGLADDCPVDVATKAILLARTMNQDSGARLAVASA